MLLRDLLSWIEFLLFLDERCFGCVDVLDEHLHDIPLEEVGHCFLLGE